MKASEDFRRQLEGYGLTTARIRYFFPDNPTIINPGSLLRQFYDIYPDFPELKRYLGWWRQEIEAPIESVVITHSRLIKPTEILAVDGIIRLH